MAKIYFRRIMAGEMTLEDVPARWREAVRKLLEEEYARREAEEQAMHSESENPGEAVSDEDFV